MAKYYIDENGLKTLLALLKGYTDEKVADVSVELFTPVSSLPTSDISTNTIYVVPGEATEDKNVFDEYYYKDGAWEKMGSVYTPAEVDLTGYLTGVKAGDSNVNATVTVDVSSGVAVITVSVPYATASQAGVVQVDTTNGLNIGSNGKLGLDEATTNKAGALSAEDKTKLDELDPEELNFEPISDEYITEAFNAA